MGGVISFEGHDGVPHLAARRAHHDDVAFAATQRRLGERRGDRQPPRGEVGVVGADELVGDCPPRGLVAQRDARADLGAINAALESLIAHELAVRLPRRPGQKEERYAHLLGGEVREGDGGAAMPAVAAPAADAPPPVAPPPPADDRLGRLEREVAALREELEELRARLPAQL